MSDRSVVVMGLPGSGKTTYLAALWHLVSEGEIDAKLKYVSLRAGNIDHLHAIATRWREAKAQDRTSLSGNKLVSMVLQAEDSKTQTVTFPDVAGETFLQMWGQRECDETTASLLKEPGVLLFIHADKVSMPKWVIEETLLNEELGIEREDTELVEWSPNLAPTQVQLTDLLQSMRSAPLDVGPRRLAIILSAWDKVKRPGLRPNQYLAKKMPLLDQFLKYSLANDWEVRIYGVSAQGGEYDDESSLSTEAKALREIDMPSKRILVAYEENDSHDLTEPLQWLLV